MVEFKILNSNLRSVGLNLFFKLKNLEIYYHKFKAELGSFDF